MRTKSVTVQNVAGVAVYVCAGVLDQEYRDLVAGLKMAQTRLGAFWDGNLLAGIIIGRSKDEVFQAMETRDVDSMLVAGYIVIYLDGGFQGREEYAKRILHEYAHLLLRKFPNIGAALKQEFVDKFQTLKMKLQQMHFPSDFRPSFELPNLELDSMLNQIGYESVAHWMGAEMANPYGMVSLPEYWATLFEIYFMGGKEQVAQASPRFKRALKQVNA